MMVGYGGHTTRDPTGLITYARRHESAASLIDAIEKRTQKTYRYGIGLVCIGATLNWLGFAQGNSYVDPLRYLGVASVVSGSFCVCLAMCRWLGRPMAGHASSLDQDSLSSRSSGDVHVFNVAIPMFISSSDDYRPSKPPDYEIVAAGELPPPNYDEAIKLTPGSLMESGNTHPDCEPAPSHSLCPLLISEEPRKSIDATTGPPPPPYHPSPARFCLPSKKTTNLNATNTTNLNRNLSSVNSNDNEQMIRTYWRDEHCHFSPEQKRLLGLKHQNQHLHQNHESNYPLTEETASLLTCSSVPNSSIVPPTASVSDMNLSDVQNQNERYVQVSITDNSQSNQE